MPSAGLAAGRIGRGDYSQQRMAWTTLCTVDVLFKGLGKYVEIDGFRLAVFLDAETGEVSVTDDACPHAGLPLSDGHVAEKCVVCPAHGWTFNLKTGALIGSPIEEPVLTVYPSRILEENDKRFVQADLPMP